MLLVVYVEKKHDGSRNGDGCYCWWCNLMVAMQFTTYLCVCIHAFSYFRQHSWRMQSWVMLLQQEIEFATVICRFNYYIAGDGSDANMFHTIYSQTYLQYYIKYQWCTQFKNIQLYFCN